MPPSPSKQSKHKKDSITLVITSCIIMFGILVSGKLSYHLSLSSYDIQKFNQRSISFMRYIRFFISQMLLSGILVALHYYFDETVRYSFHPKSIFLNLVMVAVAAVLARFVYMDREKKAPHSNHIRFRTKIVLTIVAFLAATVVFGFMTRQLLV